MGLLNNSLYVVMNAGAKQIAANGVGLVYIANVAPALVVKGLAPLWADWVPYRMRVLTCAGLMCVSLALVAGGTSPGRQLIGVAVGAVASAIGEATFLALSSRYEGGCSITAWSSGTGFAGVFGYFWVYLFVTGLGASFTTCLTVANLLPLAWLMTFFLVLAPGGRVPQAQSFDPVPISETNEVNTSQNCSSSSREHGASQGRLGTDHRDRVREGGRHHGADEQLMHVPEPFAAELGIADLDDDNDDDDDDDDETCGEGGACASDGAGNGQHAAHEHRAASHERIDLGGSDGHWSLRDRLGIVWKLRAFTAPLFTVYMAEYTMQSGAWAAIGFPITDKAARDSFYVSANWMYQIGVFASRSSGMLFSVTKEQLWIMPGLQTLLLLFFVFNGIEHIWWNHGLLLLALLAGLLGGAVYVHGFILIGKHTHKSQREVALASASVADGCGILVADVLGLVVQGCLYGANGLTDDGKAPVFRCGYSF